MTWRNVQRVSPEEQAARRKNARLAEQADEIIKRGKRRKPKTKHKPKKPRGPSRIEPDFETRDCAIHFDGACEPKNPGGTATFGYVLDWGDGRTNEGWGFVCRGEGATNNVAEWAALQAALERLVDMKFRGVLEIYGDSALVIHQLTRRWRCHASHLAEARDRCLLLLRKVAVSWRAGWIPREQNWIADELSKRAYYESLDDEDGEYRAVVG